VNVTEAFHDDSVGIPPTSTAVSVQCDLCLHPISFFQESVTEESHQILCPSCGYHQPFKKHPRWRDMAAFAGAVGAVYFTTLIAVFFTR
jgi:hypothetical protein